MRSFAERVAAVHAVVTAARTVAVQPDLVPALQASTGLSRQGVELALANHLELTPTDGEIAALVTATTEASHVAVILSANVFVGALRAIAIACAAAPSVVVRPSRRDPVFATRLVTELPALRLSTELTVEDVPEGEIHVYGRDETIADVRRRASVPVRGHGAGMGIAWATSAAEAEALAVDVVAFDQRGCLSPRIVFAPAGALDVVTTALHEALLRALPRGPLTAEERAESERYLATMAYAGRILAGPEHALGIAERSAPLVVPPPSRHVHVVPVASPAEAIAQLAPFRRLVTALGADTDEGRTLAPSWARLSRLGQMQRPPLDGPVDRRS